jgi:hypothetical protein
LPFTNLSRDPDQDYFSDGLTEDIITALSRWRSFPVISRNSTFTYKGHAVPSQQIARELGARPASRAVSAVSCAWSVVTLLTSLEQNHREWWIAQL